ncbi:MAG: hypothetical protein WBB29_05385 [Geitlerinemataceae cyanobacterium]
MAAQLILSLTATILAEGSRLSWNYWQQRTSVNRTVWESSPKREWTPLLEIGQTGEAIGILKPPRIQNHN